MPRKPKTPDVMPTEAEVEAEHQQTLYEHGCLLLEYMSKETRQKFFAHVKEHYRTLYDQARPGPVRQPPTDCLQPRLSQATLYGQICLYLEYMTDETHSEFFTWVKDHYRGHEEA